MYFRIKRTVDDIEEPIGGGTTGGRSTGTSWGKGSTLRTETIGVQDLASILQDLRTVTWGRSTAIKLPVGTGGLSVLGPGGGVSTVVSGTGTVGSSTIPPSIDRRDIPQNTEVIPMNVSVKSVSGGKFDVTIDGTTWRNLTRKEADTLVASKGAGAGPDGSPANIAVPQTNTGGSMDLGNLLTTGLDLYGKYVEIDALKNAQMPVSMPTTTPAFLPDWGDAIDFFTDPSTGETVAIPKKKCVKRRRRKRLATTSDIKDLAALKAVLGNGEAFKTWIATHSR